MFTVQCSRCYPIGYNNKISQCWHYYLMVCSDCIDGSFFFFCGVQSEDWSVVAVCNTQSSASLPNSKCFARICLHYLVYMWQLLSAPIVIHFYTTFQNCVFFHRNIQIRLLCLSTFSIGFSHFESPNYIWPYCNSASQYFLICNFIRPFYFQYPFVVPYLKHFSLSSVNKTNGFTSIQ